MERVVESPRQLILVVSFRPTVVPKPTGTGQTRSNKSRGGTPTNTDGVVHSSPSVNLWHLSLGDYTPVTSRQRQLITKGERGWTRGGELGRGDGGRVEDVGVSVGGWGTFDPSN